MDMCTRVLLGTDSYKNNRMEKYVKEYVSEVSRIKWILFKWITELLNGKALEPFKFHTAHETEKKLSWPIFNIQLNNLWLID